MIWGDLLTRCAVASEPLSRALGLAFGVSTDSVSVVASIEDSPGSCGVVAEVSELEGEFRRKVSIYLDESVRQADALSVARAVAASLSCEVLIPDDTTDPYSMILVCPSGAIAGIAVDVDALDVRGEYRVMRVEPHEEEK